MTLHMCDTYTQGQKTKKFDVMCVIQEKHNEVAGIEIVACLRRRGDKGTN